MKRLLYKSVLCLCKYLFVTNRSLTIVNHFLMLFFVWKNYLLFVKFQMFFALTRQLLANFFQKHLKKCCIVVFTEDAHYISCNIQLIIWSDLLLIFFTRWAIKEFIIFFFKRNFRYQSLPYFYHLRLIKTNSMWEMLLLFKHLDQLIVRHSIM